MTTVHRTLVDVGNVASTDLVEQALECALRRRLTSEARLSRILLGVGTQGRKGAAVLRELLELRPARTAPTESALETKTIQLLRAHGFPPPERQKVVRDANGFVARVDLAYAHANLIIEVDSRAHHLRRREWEKDLARRNELTSRGCLVLHATDEKLKRDKSSFLACVGRSPGSPGNRGLGEK
ncbi:MAG: DUF559 domain-containing protein [Actinomycetota bacterium]